MEIIKNSKLHVIAFIVVMICELIGTKKFGYVLILPMLWAMLIGGFISWPKMKILNLKDMDNAGGMLTTMLVLLITWLGLSIGPNLPKLMDAKLALLLQEFGHFFGTIIIGMPLAVALGMGREAVGATYSLDREANIAIIAERFGLDSPEGRGVMSMYICGTIFGAIWIAILAGFVASLDLFHPYALAMGVGVGSGSMLAAGSGAIVEYYPHMTEQIMAYAGAANLMTTILGIYFSLFISLPFAIRFHKFLSGLLGKNFYNEEEKA